MIAQNIVNDAAAYLFWMMAEIRGLESVREMVLRSHGECLLKQPFTATVLGNYGINELSIKEKRECLSAIACEANNFTLKEKNLIGIIYADDSKSGRSPSANKIGTAMLEAIPKRIIKKGREFVKMGSLCLRHPLPAVVFSKEAPPYQTIEVEDTYTALGFNLPILLTNLTTQPIMDNLYVSSGVFYIPVPSENYGKLWDSAVQNSLRVISEIILFVEFGTTEWRFEW